MDIYQIVFSLVISFCLGYLFRNNIIPYLEKRKLRKEAIIQKTQQDLLDEYLNEVGSWIRASYVDGNLELYDIRNFKVIAQQLAVMIFTKEDVDVKMSLVSNMDAYYATLEINDKKFRLTAPWSLEKSGRELKDVRFYPGAKYLSSILCSNELSR